MSIKDYKPTPPCTTCWWCIGEGGELWCTRVAKMRDTVNKDRCLDWDIILEAETGYCAAYKRREM